MKLQQLRFLVAVAKNELNISAAAEALYTSQPGVSKQIKLLEDELGVQIFTRSGKTLTSVTPVGVKVIERAQKMLDEAANIKRLTADYRAHDRGDFSIATTHTQARYVLPPLLHAFRQQYPQVALHIYQGSPAQIADLLSSGKADIAIATEAPELFDDMILLPCYQWNRCALVPKSHPLAQQVPVTLENLAQYPLVSYVFAWEQESPIMRAFNAANLTPNVSFSATEADIIKTYVRLGMGVGIVAAMVHGQEDDDLIALPLNHLLSWSTTYIGLRPHTLLRRFMYDFIQSFAPHLTAHALREVENDPRPENLEALFKDLVLPKK